VRGLAAVALGAAVLAGGCAGRRPPDVAPPAAPPTRVLEGIASWYGPKFHGKRTASGERFDQDARTAAHATLPFGTQVRVTNLENGRSVEVVINDRPGRRDRIIDVSRAAGRALGLIGPGTAPVRLEVMPE